MTRSTLIEAAPRAGRGVHRFEGTEDQEQAALFQWAAMWSGVLPPLRAMFAVPNSSRRTRSGRASNAIAGLNPGVPDICLPYRCGPYGALYIELKVGDNDTSDEQDAWLRRLHKAGNAVTVQYGWVAAAGAIIEYLSEPDNFVSGP